MIKSLLNSTNQSSQPVSQLSNLTQQTVSSSKNRQPQIIKKETSLQALNINDKEVQVEKAILDLNEIKT